MVYKLKLSTGESITITQEERLKFENNLDKSFIKIGDSIINPSFVVSITVDKEATYQQGKYTSDRLPAPEKDVKKIGTYLNVYKPKFLKS